MIPTTTTPIHQHPQSTVFYDLSTLILTLLRSSSLLPEFDDSPSRRTQPQITPGGLASLMLGASLAMMLCGSVTFIIGFMLMPWVIGLVMLLYVAGLVTGVSMLARAIVCQIGALASPTPKLVPEWKLL